MIGTQRANECLGTRASSKCPHTDMPEPGFVQRSAKGKGERAQGRKARGSRGLPADEMLSHCMRAGLTVTMGSSGNPIRTQIWSLRMQMQQAAIGGGRKRWWPTTSGGCEWAGSLWSEESISRNQTQISRRKRPGTQSKRHSTART